MVTCYCHYNHHWCTVFSQMRFCPSWGRGWHSVLDRAAWQAQTALCRRELMCVKYGAMRGVFSGICRSNSNRNVYWVVLIWTSRIFEGKLMKYRIWPLKCWGIYFLKLVHSKFNWDRFLSDQRHYFRTWACCWRRACVNEEIQARRSCK